MSIFASSALFLGVGPSVYGGASLAAGVIEGADFLPGDAALLPDAFAGVDEGLRAELKDLVRGWRAATGTDREEIQREFAARIRAVPQDPWREAVAKISLHRLGEIPSRRYSRFLDESLERLIDHLEQGVSDRGLIVSPLGLRDLTEAFLERLLRRPHSGPVQQALVEKETVLIVQGKENFKRWQGRLSRLTGETIQDKEQAIFERDGIKIRLASIHELSRMEGPDLRGALARAGVVILDKEHHVRPIEDDPEDKDRSRFIRVLVEGGFLSPDFQIQKVEGQFLLGLTESVAEGAAGIYGGAKGLIFSEDLPSLLKQGLVIKPETRVYLPKPLATDKPVHEAWGELGLVERVEHLEETIVQLDRELSREEKIPRMAVYAGSREEAMALAARLQAEGRYRDRAALVISGDPEIEARRDLDWRDFVLGVRPIVIHVEALVEGVDEFQSDPLAAVIFAGVERAGGLRYALQSVGAHLGAQSAPLFVDLAGMFFRHPGLTAFDPSVYILEAGEIKRGSPLKSARPAGPRGGREVLKDTDVLTIDLFGEAAGENLGRYLRQLSPVPNAGAIAFGLGYSQELSEDLLAGRFVPNARLTVERLAEALGLDSRESGFLLHAWALDRLRYYETRHPMPQHLPDNEQALLKAARYMVIRRYGGMLGAVSGIKTETLRRYLEEGVSPENPGVRRNFFKALGNLVGKKYVERHLGRRILGDYFRPGRLDALDQTAPADLETLFDLVAGEKGQRPSEIIWQTRVQADGSLSNPSPLAVGEENQSRDYAKLRIGDLGGGRYAVTKARGTGAKNVVEGLRRAEGLKEVLTIRSDGWIGLRALRKDDLFTMETGDIEAMFQAVAKEKGQRPSEIIWQTLVQADGSLSNPSSLAVGEENQSTNYAKIQISDLGGGRYAVTKARGTRARNVVEGLRRSEGLKEVLTIRSDGWIGLRALHKDDLSTMETGDIEAMFQAAAEEKGQRPSEIIWQTLVQADGSLVNPSPLAVGEENKGYGYAKLRISDLGGGRYAVTKARGTGAKNVVEGLRRAEGLKEVLTIRADGWIGLRALRTDDLSTMEPSDIEAMFQTVAEEKGQRPSEIIWQMQVHADGSLVNPSPLAVGEKNQARNYAKLRISDLGGGRYAVTKAWGTGATKILAALKSSPLAQGPEAVLRIQ
ncbi:MAG: hypothetical protein HY609_06855 [Deltaproteobacteria bacterium]|nr:hypothetical protein [Deltaproteobacteria bacterium]MBI4224639.1 hypothetical protein [Deltaproteobacteria bacterium]